MTFDVFHQFVVPKKMYFAPMTTLLPFLYLITFDLRGYVNLRTLAAAGGRLAASTAWAGWQAGCHCRRRRHARLNNIKIDKQIQLKIPQKID
jgi:hypothetical protein